MLKFNKFARKHFGEYIGKRMPVYTASAVVWFADGNLAWGGLEFYRLGNDELCGPHDFSGAGAVLQVVP